MAAPIYVDRLRTHRSRSEPARSAGEQFGHRWCHLWSEDLDALHSMAERLGMRREWFQDRPGFPHYDLPPFRREAALAHGAVEHSLKDWLRARRRALTPQQKAPSPPPGCAVGRSGIEGSEAMQPEVRIRDRGDQVHASDSLHLQAADCGYSCAQQQDSLSRR